MMRHGRKRDPVVRPTTTQRPTDKQDSSTPNTRIDPGTTKGTVVHEHGVIELPAPQR